MSTSGAAQRASWTWAHRDDAITAVSTRITCTAIGSRTRAALSRVLAQQQRVDFSQLGRCFSAGRGAWALSASVTYGRASQRFTPMQGRWTLVYIDDEGRELSAASPSGELVIDLQGSESAHIIAVHDIDDDGVGEVVIERENWDEEGSSPPARSIAGLRAGAVGPYAEAQRFEGFTLGDVDGDGRIDLLLPSEYSATVRLGMSADLAVGPSLVAHGRADGTFSVDDDVALAFRFAQCPSAPRLLVQRTGDEPARVDADKLIENIACARTWGASARAVLAQLDAEWSSREENEVLRESAREAVSTEPALSLRDVCPADRSRPAR